MEGRIVIVVDVDRNYRFLSSKTKLNRSRMNVEGSGVIFFVLFCSAAHPSSPLTPAGAIEAKTTAEALGLLPEFELGCILHIVTSEFEFAATTVELEDKLIAWSARLTTQLVLSNQSDPEALRAETHRDRHYNHCAIFLVISRDEHLLLETISASNAAFRDQTPFFGVITGAVHEFRLKQAFSSSVFYERHPLVLLIAGVAVEEPDWTCRWCWRWCVVCFLCDAVTQWQDAATVPIPRVRTSEALRHIYSSLNKDGNRREGETRGIWTGLYLFYDSNWTLRESPKDIEPQAREAWRGWPLVEVLGNTLVHRFNLTFTLVQNPYAPGVRPSPEFSGQPRVILCLNCQLVAYAHTELVLLTMDEYAHLYCTRKATLQQASLVFFLRPFDMWSWACLAALTLLFAVGLLAFGNSGVRFQQVWYTLDIL